MHIDGLWAFGLFITSAICAPASRHVVHEKRDVVPDHWVRGSRVSSEAVVPVRIGLVQSNLIHGHDALMKVSDPDSPAYGRHWTAKQIADFFAPSKQAVDEVMDWISSSGIEHRGLQHSTNLGWIEFSAAVEDIERLLDTQYHLYHNSEARKGTIACSQYSVPEHVQQYIDFITPTLHFDALAKGPGSDVSQKRSITSEGKPKPPAHWYTGPKKGPKLGPKLPKAIPEAAKAQTNCSTGITPSCLRSLYKIPVGTLNKTTFGILEFAPETFLQTDLNMFFNSTKLNDAKVPVNTSPKFEGVDGGFLVPVADGTGFEIQGEPDLDLEYAMTLVYPQEVTLFQVGDNGEFSQYISFNNFLDAIDKSYCTFRGGDSRKFDEPFPDRNGYPHKHQCGVFSAPATLSASYAATEHELTPRYQHRQCHEYMKLGLAGTSFLFSSGDTGVASPKGCIDTKTGQFNNGNSGRFAPSFPNNCPYVTSVGATQLASSNLTTDPEVACETVILSGGGFSDVFALPSYQAGAVQSYFANNVIPYSAAQYNNSMRARGYPDVSANGASFITAIDGKFQLVFGTSASAPTFASIITLINNERADQGKTPLGFLNPAFYKNPGMFNDIVSGNNPGCGTSGFAAVPGWDPITGLGTPDYVKMAKVLVDL